MQCPGLEYVGFVYKRRRRVAPQQRALILASGLWGPNFCGSPFSTISIQRQRYDLITHALHLAVLVLSAACFTSLAQSASDPGASKTEKWANMTQNDPFASFLSLGGFKAAAFHDVCLHHELHVCGGIPCPILWPHRLPNITPAGQIRMYSKRRFGPNRPETDAFLRSKQALEISNRRS
jgi:hypothetical protein